MSGRARSCAVACLVALALPACGFDDALFFGWDDRRVLCGQVIDDIDRDLDVGRVLGRMDDAATYQQVYNVYAHTPGVTIRPALVDRMLDEAALRKLAFVTYHDMLDHADPRGGLAFAFDDNAIDAWFTLRDTLDRHHAHVTFFVTRYYTFTDEQKLELQELAADGHDIEAHGVDHLNATDYVAAHGMAAYLDNEALPSVAQLVGDGFPASVFAYPFGAHDDDIDRAMLTHVDLVRTTAGPCPW